MKKYIIRKLSELVIVMFLISFLSFAVIYIAPGDISSSYINPKMTKEEVEQVKEHLGLNKSMIEQYGTWLKMALRGNWGMSYSNHKDVVSLFKSRLPATISLMGSALVLSVVLAIPLGLISGLKKNTWIDNLISGISYVGMSIPSFWLGMLLIIFFSATLGLLPSSGMHTIGENSIWDTIKHMILPCTTLCLGNMAIFIRYMRANTIGELSEEYILTAISKGTPSLQILKKHVLRNVLLPIITLVGMNIGLVVCGSFIIESVFGWPGIGTLAMAAINARDYPVIMAYIMFSGLIIVIGNFIADILYAIADPRIKRGVRKINE